MKKFLFIFASVMTLMSVTVNAGLVPVNMQDSPEVRHGKGNHVPALRPTVMFDDELSQLTITTPYYIDQMTVVIRNEEGDVIESSTFSISDSQTINLTEDVMNEMYSVELLFGDHHMIGYFMAFE